MPRQVVEPASAGNDRLLRREPSTNRNAFRDQCAGFDIRVLDIDSANAELLVPEQTLELAHPVIFDEI